MTGPVDPANDHELLSFAPLVALNALSEFERAQVLADAAASEPSVRAQFDAEVASARESLADLSAATATPPPALLRARVLESVAGLGVPTNDRRSGTPSAERPSAGQRLLGRAASGTAESGMGVPRRRLVLAAAAAAVVIAVGGGAVGYFVSEGSDPVQTTADRVFDSSDVRTISGPIATGQATLTYSESAGAAVLVMNDVPPPAAGTVYQYWLVGQSGERLGGVMGHGDVASSTTATVDDLGDATAIVFTVGSDADPQRRVGGPVAQLPIR